MKQDYDIPCDFGTDVDEFEHYVGRKPKKGEMEEWVDYLKEGVDAQLDWDMINSDAADNFE